MTSDMLMQSVGATILIMWEYLGEKTVKRRVIKEEDIPYLLQLQDKGYQLQVIKMYTNDSTCISCEG